MRPHVRPFPSWQARLDEEKEHAAHHDALDEARREAERLQATPRMMPRGSPRLPRLLYTYDLLSAFRERQWAPRRP